MPSRETLEMFTSEESPAGFLFGLAALAVGVSVVFVWRRLSDTPAPIVGLLLTGATIAAMQTTQVVSGDLWLGIVLLTLAGALHPWARKLPLLPAALAIPGAWWVTRIVELPGAAWAPYLLFGWIVVGAPLVTSFDRHFAVRGYGPPLLAISIGGMLATLPDTEEILLVFGVALPLAILAWPKALASLGAVGAYPTLGLLAWVIAVGGRGRASAIIGATACLALLAVEPLVRWRRKRTLLDRIPDRRSWVPAVAGLQLLLVLLAARRAGLSDQPQRAAVVVMLVLSIAGTILAAGAGRSTAQFSEDDEGQKEAQFGS